MGVYVQTTKTVTKRINYVYRCSKCKKAIAQSAFISGSSNYNERSMQAAEKAEAAQKVANSISDEHVKKALDKAAVGNYKPMHISAHCPKCKHREPWQRMKLPALLVGSPFCLILGAIILSSGLSPHQNTVALIIGIALLAFPFVLGFGNLFYRNKMNKLSAELPEASRPHFFLPGDDAALQQALSSLDLQSDEQLEINLQDFPK